MTKEQGISESVATPGRPGPSHGASAIGRISAVRAVDFRLPEVSAASPSFTHLNPNGSRFSVGSYGVYYASRELPTGIAETVFHLGQFYAATADPPHAEAMRVLVGKIDASFHGLRGGKLAWAPCLDPNDYASSFALGRRLRDRGSNGIVYPSVRRTGGQYLDALRPQSGRFADPERHPQYVWDGGRIGRYFDYAEERWVTLAS